MNPSAIVFPGIAMFFLTFAAIVMLGYRRVTAVQRGDVSIRYYRLYNEGEQPAALQLIGRHVQNHFEVPPLFYVVLLFLYVTASVTPFSVALAWLYVALRCLHSFIHLGSNDVRRRLLAWAASVFTLAGLWLSLLVSLIARA
jgi:hypothetical protein